MPDATGRRPIRRRGRIQQVGKGQPALHAAHRGPHLAFLSLAGLKGAKAWFKKGLGFLASGTTRRHADDIR